MNRRKFLSHIAKGSAGIAATAVLGTTIIDALIPEKTNLGADGTFNSATLIKGHQHLKVGYVYAPYIPVLKTPLINNEYKVKTVFGFGGGYAIGGKMLAVICFLKETISKKQSVIFQALGPTFILGTQDLVSNKKYF